ncbi:DUF4405 domain-containing protein [Maridesulfovibrio sp. FT414]|uniref:DUF4405 domain-containing protein n=1 Tax=Maridesulfovibrio sp. FT414 TaxID=2979469 RepID=UPI003D804FF3
MLGKITDRSFLSPVVAFTFVPVALTGILLLFHIRFPGIKDIHNWIGLAFVIFSSFHIAVNWKPLVGYLRKTTSKYALITAVALTVVCCIIGFNSDEARPGHHGAGYSQVQRY